MRELKPCSFCGSTSYISREAVNELIEDVRNNHFILMSDRVTLALLKSKVTEIPAADVQPVRRGKWEQIGEQSAKCTECGGVLKSNGVDKTGKALIFNGVYHYCPFCGADMCTE